MFLLFKLFILITLAGTIVDAKNITLIYTEDYENELDLKNLIYAYDFHNKRNYSIHIFEKTIEYYEDELLNQKTKSFCEHSSKHKINNLKIKYSVEITGFKTELEAKKFKLKIDSHTIIDGKLKYL